MKKFLTVLLALSVVFTYSFSAAGSVFAYTVSDEQTKIAEEQKAMEDIVRTAVNEGIRYTSDGKVVSIDETLFPGTAPSADPKLNFAAISVGADKLVADMKAAIAKAGADNSGAADADFNNALKNAYAGVANSYANVIAKLVNDPVYTKVIYSKAITDAVAELEAEFAKYDPANYSETDAQAIRDAKAAALKTVDNATTDTSTGLEAVIAATNTFKTAVSKINPVTDANEELTKAKTAAVEAITVAADKFVQGQTSYWTGVLNDPTSSAAEIVEAQLKLELIDSASAPLVAIYTAQIEAVELDADKTVADALAAANLEITGIKAIAVDDVFKYWSAFEKAADSLGDIDFLVKYANDYATQLKNMYDVNTGLAKYNVATVDKKLAEVVADIQNLKITSAANIRLVLGAIPTAEAEAAALKAYKATKIAEITTNTAAGNYAKENWNWSETRMDAVEAIQKDYTAKIKAAATEDAIDDLVKEAKKAMDAYLNNTQKTIVTKNIGRAMTALGYDTDLAKYAAGVAAKKPGEYSQDTIDAVVAAAEEVLYTAVLDKNDADILQAEIKAILTANYSNAMAVIDVIKTDAEIEAATKAIIDAIKALPTTATLENKAQYLEVQKSLEEFVDIPGTDLVEVTNFGTFRTYMSKIVSLEKSAVEAAVRAIPYTVTVDSRAAIEAARAAMDAYEDAYEDYTAANADGFKYGYTNAVNAATLEAKEEALENAQMVDAAKKIAALPAVITVDDKAQVEAARASYDLLSDESKEVFSIALYNKLVDAEAQLKTADKDYIIAETKGMKIVVSTKLYTKSNKIRVNWKVKEGDTSVITGYQVYKSTKAQTGYKYMGKTTKNYMDNKKNLKKGQRFYYKVRAYVDVDGERYYSDWSNKGNRIYR